MYSPSAKDVDTKKLTNGSAIEISDPDLYGMSNMILVNAITYDYMDKLLI